MIALWSVVIGDVFRTQFLFTVPASTLSAIRRFSPTQFSRRSRHVRCRKSHTCLLIYTRLASKDRALSVGHIDVTAQVKRVGFYQNIRGIRKIKDSFQFL